MKGQGVGVLILEGRSTDSHVWAVVSIPGC